MNRLTTHLAVACSALVPLGCTESGGGGGTAGDGGSAGVADTLDCTGGQDDAAWASFGQDLCNSRAQSETTISSDNASDLEPKWVFDGFTEDDVEHQVGDISATPSVVGDSVYFVDWTEGDEEAKVYRIHKDTAEVVWWRYIWDIADFVEPGNEGERIPIPGLVSRTSPLVVGDSVIIGTQRRRPELYEDPRPNAWIVSLNKDTGAVQWKTEPPRDPLWPTPAQDPNPKDEMGNDLLPIPDGSEVVITASPVAYDNRIYVGVSGWAEFLSFWAHFRFFFRGSVLCLDADNGEVIWQSFMVDDDLYVNTEEPEMHPDTEQPIPRDRRRYSGNSVWSSAPAIDIARGRLYVTTGNNHTAPQTVLQDVGSGAITDLPQPGNYMDSIVALDLSSGAVEWSYSPVSSLVDVWQIFCRDTDSEACAEGPDFDYGAGANLFSVEIDGNRRDVVGAGSKAGTYSAIDADAASPRPTPLWETQVGPGSHFGGIHWGTSVENGMVYAPVGDGFRESGENGFFAAINGATGDFEWKVPNPIADVGSPPTNYPAAFGGVDMNIHAPTTVANGVVFAAPFDLEGHMLALDAANGDLLWSYPSGATVYGGAAVAEGVVYWGNGYQTVSGTRGTGLFAFHVPDVDPMPCDGTAPEIGETIISIQHEGRERAYLLYVPAGYDHDEPIPLLLNFHGTGSSALAQRGFSEMDEWADAYTVLVAYPEGLPLGGSGQVFDAGLRDFSSAPRDDVDFARAIVDDVADRACVDRRRVYSTGMSNGARMSYRIACEAADLVAAIAPVAGVLSLAPEDCHPSRPVPAIHFHGTADALAPYDEVGGASAITVPDMFSLWAEKSDCTGAPVPTVEQDDVGCESYESCADGAEVELCTIEGAGHCWPGNAFCPFGSSTETIHASQAMLDFMLPFELPEL